MKWQPNSKTNLPPRGSELDIVVKGRRRTGYTYMAALNVFRSKLTQQHVSHSEVSHWIKVELPTTEKSNG
ncbi:hypothetical protein VPHK404_0012 [Vibrio phage K404]